MYHSLPRALATLLLLLLIPASTGAQTLAQLRAPNGESGTTLPLPTPIDRRALQNLSRQVSPATIPLRSYTDLGERFRPRYLEGSGVALWVRLDGLDAPVLLSAFAHLAQAVRIELQVGGEWVPVQTRYGTPMFDLTLLEAATPEAAAVLGALREVSPMEIARHWSPGATVYCPTDRNEHGEREIIIGAIGSPPEAYSYYVRALFPQHNGYPVVSVSGELLAITSIMVDDRAGGSLAIPFGYIHTWREEWPQLEGNSPIGWEPRVRTRREELQTGPQALEPRRERGRLPGQR